MRLEQLQLQKNVHIGGKQTSLLEAHEFDMDADWERRLIAVTVKRTGKRHIITFEGVVITPVPVEEKRVKKVG